MASCGLNLDTSAAAEAARKAGSQGAGPPTPHALSGRRLSKTLMRADSQDIEGSKNWGLCSLPSVSAPPINIRVIQKVEAEDTNMMKVTWVWSYEGATHQVELRHGRRSGIRKIYVNKVLQDRVKSVRNLLSDTGSTHDFSVGPLTGEVIISPKGIIGYNYQLKLDGMPIEQSIEGPTAAMPLDIGTRTVQLAKTEQGLGMTLRNNPLRNGVVVWTCEDNKLAAQAGIMVGDIVLSVEGHLLDSIDNLVEYVGEAQGVINMELAGTAQSRSVALVKSKERSVGLGLQGTSCGIGVLISELDPNGSAAGSSLKVGDIILSIDGTVPSSAKHVVQLIAAAEYCIKIVCIGNHQTALQGNQKGGAESTKA